MKRILNLYVKERGSPLPVSLYGCLCAYNTAVDLCAQW